MSAEQTPGMALRRRKGEKRRAASSGAPAPERPRRGGAPIIELRDVTKVYPGGHMALDRVSLAINRGEFVFLVGPTGCGKSTLIKLLIRELDATEGAVRIAGRDIGRPAGEEDPAAAPQHRHRLPGLQAAPRPHRLRQRRLRAAGDRRQPRRDPRAGAGDPAPGRPLDQAPQLPRPALRRRAAARLDRPRLRQPPAAAARRRAERQPRPGHLDRDHAAALPDQQDRHDRRRRHPRPRDGRQHAAPRDRALRGPRRPRRGHAAATPRSRRPSSACGCGPRWGSAPRAAPTATASTDLVGRDADLLLHPGGVPRAAPQRRAEHGGDRHHGRHRDPARRADPGLPDDPGEERRGPRQPRVPGRRLRRRDQGRNRRAARASSKRFPHVAVGRVRHQGRGAAAS